MFGQRLATYTALGAWSFGDLLQQSPTLRRVKAPKFFLKLAGLPEDEKPEYVTGQEFCGATKLS